MTLLKEFLQFVKSSSLPEKHVLRCTWSATVRNGPSLFKIWIFKSVI
jgi:hypothetical protein